MSTLFSCCVHQKDIAGGPGKEARVLGAEAQAETILSSVRSMETANWPVFFNIWKHKKSQISVLPCTKYV